MEDRHCGAPFVPQRHEGVEKHYGTKRFSKHCRSDIERINGLLDNPDPTGATSEALRTWRGSVPATANLHHWEGFGSSSRTVVATLPFACPPHV